MLTASLGFYNLFSWRLLSMGYLTKHLMSWSPRFTIYEIIDKVLNSTFRY